MEHLNGNEYIYYKIFNQTFLGEHELSLVKVTFLCLVLCGRSSFFLAPEPGVNLGSAPELGVKQNSLLDRLLCRPFAASINNEKVNL